MNREDALDAAFADRDRLSKGWIPPGETWADAPTMNAWVYGVHPYGGGMRLTGTIGDRIISTSPVIAMVTGTLGFGWARTIDGWIRLARTDDRLHRPGRLLVPDEAYGWHLAAEESGYRAPRGDLAPTGRLESDPAWEAAAAHFDRTARIPETAFAVFYARRKRLAIDDAIKAVEAFWIARAFDFS